MSARLFPGSRSVWIAAGGTAVILLVVLLVALLQPRDVYTGSSSVGARNGIGVVADGQKLCAQRQRVPSGTGVVRFAADARDVGLRAVRAEVTFADGRRLTGSAPWSGRFIEIPVAGLEAATRGPRSALATVCLQPDGADVDVWGQTLKQSNELALRLDGKAVASRLAIWYRPPGDVERPILGQLGDMFERASLFRPGGVGPWTFALILGLVFPLLIYGAIRLVATGESRSVRRVAAGVAVLTFVHCASWAFVTPAFQTPDEGEHYAYAQYLAETGNAVDPAQGERPPWSSEQGVALEAIRYASVIERADTDFPWDPVAERLWRARTNEGNPERTNGGGYHPASSSHSPAYYSLLVPAYKATEGRSTFTKLTAMRLTSAILAALTAALAALVALELLPGRRSLAAVAGLLVGFLPTFAFMGGGINNDNGVNLVAAALIYFVVRALRRGMTPAVAAGIGVTLAAAPILKGTAYALYPPVVLALVLLAWRHRSLRGLASLVAAAAGFALVHFGWQEIAATFERSVFTLPGGGSPVTSLGARNDITGFLSWLFQVMVPYKFDFMTDYTLVKWPFFDIYVERGFAAFGWYALYFEPWVYALITLVGAALIALGVVALWRFRRELRSRWATVAFLLLVPITVITGVEAAFFTKLGIPHPVVAEQGRYAFTALTAVTALAAGACFGLGRDRAVALGAVLATAMVVLAYAGQWLTMFSFYL